MKKSEPQPVSRRVAMVHDPHGLLTTKHEYQGDVGYDLGTLDDYILLADGKWHTLDTGVRVAPPPGFWFELCGRSSSLGRGIIVGRGIIDAGYRGTMVMIVKNDTGRSIHIRSGERIAQLIVHPIISMDFELVTDASKLPKSERGNSGFGSTGS